MKKLFLASYFTEVIDLFVQVVGNLHGKSVTFIPTASLVEPVKFYVDDAKNTLIAHGVQIDELNLTTATFNEIHQKLEKNDFIYISGGNTFFLLQELKRTGADKLITQYVNTGKHYIGESAGAMIMSPSIDYVQQMDSPVFAPHLADYHALHLVDFFPVPHYTNFPFEETTQKIIDTYASTLNLIPINNNQAIVVDGHLVEIKTKNKG